MGMGQKVTQTTNAATPVANAFSQSQANYANGGMNAVLSQLLAGRPGDPNSLNQFFNATPQQGMAQINDVNGTGPAYNNVNLNQPGQVTPGNIAYNAPTFQGTTLGGVQTGFNAPTLPQVQSGVNGFVAPTLQNVQPGMVGNINFNPANAPNVVNPDANIAALKAVFAEQQNNDIANLRERFGNQGLSSGAMLAESNYRAQAAPQLGLAVDEATRANNAQALTQRGQDLSQNDLLNSFMLQQRGQNVQQNQFGAQTGLALNDQQIAASGQQNQFNLGAGGLNLQAGQGNQNAAIAQMNANLQAMGLSNDAILQLNNQMLNQSGQQNQFNQQNAQNQFGADQSNVNAFLQAAGINQQGQLAFNGQMLDQNNMFNAFNQQNALFGQNAQQMNNQNAMQNQGIGNAFVNNQQQTGLGMQGNQLQAQIAALTQMMNNLRQTQALGMPQAENVVNPSKFSQVTGAINGALQGIGSIVPG